MSLQPAPVHPSASLQERFAPVPGGQVHYLEKGSPIPGRPSLLFCPGNWEPAWRAIPLLEGLEGHALAITARGHGKSFVPPAGYGLEAHVADLHAVVAQSGAHGLCVAGFSRGVGYALGYFAAHPAHVQGLVLMDAPPVHSRPGPGYVDYWRDKQYLGHRILDHWDPKAIEALAEEAREVHFPERLPRVDIPVQILRGTDPASVVPSLLSEEDMDLYRRWIPHAQVVILEHAGHMLLDEELGKCRKVLGGFLDTLARMAGGRSH